MRHELLWSWTELIGEVFATEYRGPFFHSLVRMQKPQNILELGTGLGTTAFWMAQAVKENGRGHVWTVDNGGSWPHVIGSLFSDAHRVDWVTSQSREETSRRLERSPELQPLLVAALGELMSPPDAPEHLQLQTWIHDVATVLGVRPQLDQLTGSLSLEQTHPDLRDDMEGQLKPVLEQPIDLLFSDTQHSPENLLCLLTRFLPWMAPSSSIFIDSAATALDTHLTAHRVADQINHGKLPAIFLAGTSPEQRQKLTDFVMTRRLTVIDLVEGVDRQQNSVLWIKIEPVNVVPYPLSRMHEMGRAPNIPRERIVALFEQGTFTTPEFSQHYQDMGTLRTMANGLSPEQLRQVLAFIGSIGANRG